MYCTPADLIANIGGLTADNTKTPTSFLQDVIDRKCAYINSQISNRYVTPVVQADSPNSYLILKDICINLSREDVAIKLNVATISGENDQSPPYVRMVARAMDHLANIRTARLDLPDAVRCSECEAFRAGYYNTDFDEVEGLENYIADQNDRYYP